jgi:3-hydroxyacyl-CoA dehydrogenase
MGKIRKNYANSVQRGRFTQAFVDERLKLITPVLNYDAFSEVDMVIEAVFEGMALKKTVFADLDRACRRERFWRATRRRSISMKSPVRRRGRKR